MSYSRFVKDVEDLRDHMRINRVRSAFFIAKKCLNQGCKFIYIDGIVPRTKDLILMFSLYTFRTHSSLSKDLKQASISKNYFQLHLTRIGYELRRKA